MGEPGTRTVSLLISDLVGSTAIAGRLSLAAADDLRREHFALLRGSLERAGGSEVKNLGDGLMVVFESAVQSLRCAIEMQQAIVARNRRAEQQLEVRIGVSMGDTTVEEGDYFGEPVVEAARLCAHARGGQILVNALVRHAARAREGHTFEALGRVELKGISVPVEAFELRWEPLAPAAIALPERLREVPATSFVGRMAERRQLAASWEQARAGALRVALLGGEAGVGKTRLATHLALEVHADSATVLYGRCEEDLGVPYEPWTQALGHLVAELPRSVLDQHVERHGGDLARLVGALAERIPGLAPPRQSDPETERYLLYAAVAALLAAAGEHEPLLLIVDDLHWADQPTLSLLRHLVAEGSSGRVMILGTYRDSDLSHDHPLTALLADLHREQGVERLLLTGLQAEEVLGLTEALVGREMDQHGRVLADEITRETAGNPFFAVELLRHLTESGAIVEREGERWQLVGEVSELGLPQSVREVIGRRVERLGGDARTALTAAAVIGRDFELDLLVNVVDISESRLVEVLDESVAVSLLHEGAGHAGHFTFTHALVEYALYEELGRTRRATLHRQVAEALEEQCGDDPGERLGELAGHWIAAVVGADVAKAMDYARRTAQRALDQLAPDEAVRWYRQALDLCERAHGQDRSERCELLISLGEAQRQAGSPESRRTLLDAALLAHELGDRDRLARAVLANTRGWPSDVGLVDSERVGALQLAAEALGDEDPKRARVLALLALELHFAGEPERCRRLAADAIELSGAAGDQSARAQTLLDASWALGTADALQERQRLVAELVALAPSLDDTWLTFWVAARRMIIGAEAGSRSHVESSLTTIRTLASSVRQPSMTYARLVMEAGWAFVQGDLRASEEWAIQSCTVGVAAGYPDAIVVFGSQQFQVSYMQGRLGELLEQMFASATEHLPTRTPAIALAMIESGRVEEARALALAADFHSIPLSQLWLQALFVWADVCARLRIPDRARELYELLAPFPGLMACAGGATVLGSVAWALGILAATVGRHEDAASHFAAAVKIEANLGAPLFRARTQISWARTLVALGRSEGLDDARRLLDEAGDVCSRLGVECFVREAAECREALAERAGSRVGEGGRD